MTTYRIVIGPKIGIGTCYFYNNEEIFSDRETVDEIVRRLNKELPRRKLAVAVEEESE